MRKDELCTVLNLNCSNKKSPKAAVPKNIKVTVPKNIKVVVPKNTKVVVPKITKPAIASKNKKVAIPKKSKVNTPKIAKNHASPKKTLKEKKNKSETHDALELITFIMEKFTTIKDLKTLKEWHKNYDEKLKEAGEKHFKSMGFDSDEEFLDYIEGNFRGELAVYYEDLYVDTEDFPSYYSFMEFFNKTWEKHNPN